jgi:hypothetical protein
MIVLLDKSASLCLLLRTHLGAVNGALARRRLPPLPCTVFEGTLNALVHTPSALAAGPCTVCSPGNLVAFMHGGFDKYLIEELGPPAQTSRLVQRDILSRHHGYVAPTVCVNVDLVRVLGAEYRQLAIHRNLGVTQLLFCPTMVVPEAIEARVAFDSIWNILSTNSLPNLIIPGFGTGYGAIDRDGAARDIVAAICLYTLPGLSLRRSMMILLHLRKDYSKFEYDGDIEELESVLSDVGRAKRDVPVSDWEDYFGRFAWPDPSSDPSDQAK